MRETHQFETFQRTFSVDYRFDTEKFSVISTKI